MRVVRLRGLRGRRDQLRLRRRVRERRVVVRAVPRGRERRGRGHALAAVVVVRRGARGRRVRVPPAVARRGGSARWGGARRAERLVQRGTCQGEPRR